MEQQSVSVVAVTIQAGQAVSSTVDLGGLQALAIVVPSGWTTAGIAFKTSPYGPDDQRLINLNGTDRPFTMVPVIDDTGTEVTVSAVASKATVLRTAGLANALIPLRWIQLVSGTNAAPVNQVATVTLYVITKSFS